MKKKQFPRHLIPAGLTTLLVISTLGWYLYNHTEAGPRYDYLQVGRGHMHVTLRETAVVAPEHRLNVTPPISGRIDSIEVQNGVAVKQGQVLAWLSSTDRAALMDAARAAGGNEVEFWKDIYKAAPLIAPVDGHIISTAVVTGQVVVAAETIFTMSDHLIIQANVDETDLNHVFLGQKAEISFDSYPDIHLTGTVHEIAYDATTVNNVTTYLVNIYFDSLSPKIRSGVSANILLVISDKDRVLRVPTDAINQDNQVLLVRKKGEPPQLQTIRVGDRAGIWTEVLSGLKEGDWIARPIFTTNKMKKGFSFVN